MQKNDNYYIPVEGKLIPVSKEIYIAFYNMERREKYLLERDQKNGLLYFSMFDNQDTVGESYIKDPDDNSPEDEILAQELHDLLHRCINALPKADRDLIDAIYFNQKSEHKYGNELGLSQNSVNYRHNQVLSKLRKLLNILGSF
jgi:RNA polymerase sigma factor (sigma-70 family)